MKSSPSQEDQVNCCQYDIDAKNGLTINRQRSFHSRPELDICSPYLLIILCYL